jgi:ActR/RegA family two-component response regulator
MPDAFTLPPNAVGITTTMVVHFGLMNKTYTTAMVVQTAKWDEVTRALEECWRKTSEQANATQAAG